MKSFTRIALSISTCLVLSQNQSDAGSMFLTGHDPDFHALVGGNAAGARNINTTAIDYILDPAFNPFVAGGSSKFLFVESSISPPSGHVVGKNGIAASGYTEGVDFEHHDASTLAGELSLLGTKYGGIVVASDFGGILTQAELDVLNVNSGSIISFLNDGGGLYAMAEGNNGRGLTPGGGHYGFLPFVVSSTATTHYETGNTVTPFGVSLGLTNGDVNGNYSHNIFTGTFGLDIVDAQSSGSILSLAGRGTVGDDGIDVPDSGTTALMFGLGLLGLAGVKRNLRRA